MIAKFKNLFSRIFLRKIELELAEIRSFCWQSGKHLSQLHEAELRRDILEMQPSSLIQYGFSVYSQNDEDGIIQHIFDKLEIQYPNFIEFGVGITENNSLYLLTKGSRGVWVDGNFGDAKSQVKSSRLKMIERFIKKSNVLSVMGEALIFLQINSAELDFISIDMDGNDFYFVEEIVKGEIYPKLFCLEYNAKFRDAYVKIDYNDSHTWAGDDHFGCSLMEYVRLLKDHYTLIACNITGANAFFIRNDYKEKFHAADPMVIYQPARYYFSPMSKGHQSSIKYIQE